jgi:hypothetical protein
LPEIKIGKIKPEKKLKKKENLLEKRKEKISNFQNI